MQAHVAPPFDVCARVAKAVSCIGDGATRCAIRRHSRTGNFGILGMDRSQLVQQ